jgi:hypothetical protein
MPSRSCTKHALAAASMIVLTKLLDAFLDNARTATPIKGIEQ